MHAVARLRRDHAILRPKLDVVEAALRLGADTWYVLREVCFTLARQLRDHIQREEALLEAYRRSGLEPVLPPDALAHQEDLLLLRKVNRLFVSEPDRSFERIKPVLAGMVKDLREHMTQEETELFPLLEQAATSEVHPMKAGADIEETMTVNRVVRDYPMTRLVFDRLFVNTAVEGTRCLDEVAWCHGMDSAELISNLQDVITRCGPAASPAEACVPVSG